MSIPHIDPILSRLLEVEDALFLPIAYRELLGREPDSQGMRHYTYLLENGHSRLSVLKDIRMSSEAKNFPNRPALPELDRFCKHPLLARLFDKLKSLPVAKQPKAHGVPRRGDANDTLRATEVPPTPHSTEPENLAYAQTEIQTPAGEEPALTSRSRSPKDYIDPTFYLSCYRDVYLAGIDPYIHYMNSGWRENRNPSCEFDTHFYRTTHLTIDEQTTVNPLQHYFDVGERLSLPTRPENSITISTRHTTDSRWTNSSLRIGIHIHLFYPNMAELFVKYLLQQPFPYDLLISTTTDADALFLKNYFNNSNLNANKLIIRKVTNRGRDIAPFLVGFQDIFSDYDVVCHLHSKRSPHAVFGEAWLSWIMDNLFGDPQVALACLQHLERTPNCAMLFPDNYFEIKPFAGWGGNEARLHALSHYLHTSIPDIPAFANFPAGSMAWFRTDFLNSIIIGGLNITHFEEEGGQVEGTLAHLLERALPFIAQCRGLSTTRFYLPTRPKSLSIEKLYSDTSLNDETGTRWMRDTPAITRNAPKLIQPLSKTFNKIQLTINWIIPDYAIGAGGHMTIFRMVQFLEQFGHFQTVWIQNCRNYPNPAEAAKSARRNYRKLGRNVHFRFLPDDVQQISGDAVIATDCWTAFPAANARNVKERFYFIQDYEPFFHPMGENYLTAEITYSFNFAALCAGAWLLKKAKEHGMWARAWDLCADTDYYYPVRNISIPNAKQKKRIAFYARSYTPRRAVGLGLAALEELARRRSDFEVFLFGETPTSASCGFPATECGILEPRQLGDLYRDADVGLVFSATNYSLIPLEMMACDLPVVELDCESTRAAFPEGTVVRAAPSVLAVADSIERVLDDDTFKRATVECARQFISKLGWEKSARTIESAITDRLLERGFFAFEPPPINALPIIRRRKVSIVIPTYNGGHLFEEVLTAASRQIADFDYDILVVDSSSTDGTREFSKRFGGRVRLHEISQNEFQHGRTRNLGVSLTEGEFVAFLTQDARPKDSTWLQQLISGFSLSPDVAGVTGRHEAYAEHNRILALDLSALFDKMRDYGPLFSLRGGLPSFIRPGSIDWRMLMHFYSDNNSALRRDIWRQLPYPEVEWGEDQIWCWNFLQLGLSKAYIDEAVVCHSHPFMKATTESVAMSEGYMFAHYFGYHLVPDGSQEDAMSIIKTSSRIRADRIGATVNDVTEYVELQRATLRGRARGALAALSM